MSDPGGETRAHDVVRAEAIAWLAALRSPQGEGQHKAFEDWYAADPRHADIYDEVVGNWETMVLSAQTPAADASARPAARSNPRSPMKWAIAAIAVLVLVLLSGIGFTTPGGGVPNTVAATTIAITGTAAATIAPTTTVTAPARAGRVATACRATTAVGSTW